MTEELKPDREFRAMHMGRHGVPKKHHRTWLGAYLQKRAHFRKYKIGTDRISVYPCWFTDTNEFGSKHWHIGHHRAASAPRDAPPGWASAQQKAAAQDGYRVSLILTPGEITALEKLASGQPWQAFAVRAILGLARTGSLCCHSDPSSCMLEASKNARREPSR